MKKIISAIAGLFRKSSKYPYWVYFRDGRIFYYQEIFFAPQIQDHYYSGRYLSEFDMTEVRHFDYYSRMEFNDAMQASLPENFFPQLESEIRSIFKKDKLLTRIITEYGYIGFGIAVHPDEYDKKMKILKGWAIYNYIDRLMVALHHGTDCGECMNKTKKECATYHKNTAYFIKAYQDGNKKYKKTIQEKTN